MFKASKFRAAAFGYFGHMWELYAFWAFIPLFLSAYSKAHDLALNHSLWSFIIIGAGSVGCVVSTNIAGRIGARKSASAILLLSGVCCLVSPMLFNQGSLTLLLGFLILWGMLVIADSPLFSTMVAQSAEPKWKGTALTIVNCIGFSVTILSIQLLSTLKLSVSPMYLLTPLSIGPVLGLFAQFTQAVSYTHLTLPTIA